MSKDRINTGELASLLATQVGGNPREAEDFLRAFVLVMEEQLLANDVMKIKGLGVFKLQWNEPRKSVDVNTAEEIMIDGYYKISFTPEPELKELVNAPFAHLQPVVLGGTEEEEMEEEEVEAVEEEVIKEMEDPGKLEEAMRSIAEQAIEIKDILAEMNMMGSVKRPHRPAMVEEDVPIELPNEMQAQVAAKEAEVKPVLKVAKASATAPVAEQSVPVRANRPGPVVPYGPPPGVEEEESENDINPEVDETEKLPEAPVVKTTTGSRTITETPRAASSDPGLRSRKITEQPIRPEHRSTHDDQAHMHDALSRKLYRKPRKTLGVVLFFVGIILGGIATYFLNTMNLLPDFSTLIPQKEKTAMIPLSDTDEYYIADTVTADSIYADSVAKARSVQKESVDSLQLLFDTPREFTVFIASEEVREGSRMTRISERHYGAKEFWVYIYEANRDLLKHPDDIAKGMVLKIPQLDPRLIDKNNPRCIEYAVQLHDKYVKK